MGNEDGRRGPGAAEGGNRGTGGGSVVGTGSAASRDAGVGGGTPAVASDVASVASPEPGLDRAGYARTFVAGVFSMMAFMMFNGTLNLSYDGIFDWSRDVSTGTSILYALLAMLAARRRPDLFRPRAVSWAVCLLLAAGSALCAMGVVLRSAPTIVAGVVLVGPADIWGVVVWMLCLARLSRRDACLLIATSGLVGIPLSAVVDGTGSYWLASAVSLLSLVAVVALCLPLTQGFFARLAQVPPLAEQRISRPGAHLSLAHTFYVFIFVFGVAYGFAIRCENGAGPVVSTLASVVASAAVCVYAWRAREATRVDCLHVAALLIVSVGFMLVLMNDPRVSQLASALLMMGYMCFQILVWLALSSAAQRNTAEAVPTICWGSAACYMGIVVGVALYLVPNDFLAPLLGGDPLLQDLLIVAVLAGLMLLSVLTRRSFVFDSAIAGIEPDASAPQVEVRYIDELNERCSRAAERWALTAREAGVMALLARGNTSSRIQEELGISYNTVKYHVKNVYAKLGVHSQQELIDLICGMREE